MLRSPDPEQVTEMGNTQCTRSPYRVTAMTQTPSLCSEVGWSCTPAPPRFFNPCRDAGSVGTNNR